MTEGIFDAARFTKLGHSAVALISNDQPPSLRNWVGLIKAHRKIIMIADPSQTTERFKSLGHYVHEMCETDAGDAPQDVIERIISKYS